MFYTIEIFHTVTVHERNWSRTGRFIISFPFSFTSLAIQRKQLVDKIVCTLNDAFSTDGAGRCRYCHKFLIQRCGRSYHKYKWKIARTNHRAATVLYLELEWRRKPHQLRIWVWYGAVDDEEEEEKQHVLLICSGNEIEIVISKTALTRHNWRPAVLFGKIVMEAHKTQTEAIWLIWNVAFSILWQMDLVDRLLIKFLMYTTLYCGKHKMNVTEISSGWVYWWTSLIFNHWPFGKSIKIK